MPEATHLMIHNDFPDREPAQTTLAAFYATHMEKGWKLVTEDGELELATSTAPALSKKLMDELHDIAEGLEIEGQADMKKAELVKAIEAAPGYYL